MGMASCKECIHSEFCFLTYKEGSIANCEFKDRSNFVEVVRCKDCKHYYHSVSSYKDGRCVMFGTYDTDPSVYLNDFCSYGERR